MIPFIEPMLYIDPQSVPVRLCAICGSECYAPGFRCFDCEEEMP